MLTLLEFSAWSPSLKCKATLGGTKWKKFGARQVMELPDGWLEMELPDGWLEMELPDGWLVMELPGGWLQWRHCSTGDGDARLLTAEGAALLLTAERRLNMTRCWL
jgi:hypothetical protein